MVTIRASLAVFIGLVFFSPFARAVPANTSVLTVEVTDPSGAQVAGAIVTIYAPEGRAVLTTTTDLMGQATCPSLIPGDYVVEVQAPGFAGAVPQRLRLDSGETRRLTVSLRLSALSQRVVVTAAATPQPDNELSKAFTVIDRGELDARQTVALTDALREDASLRVEQLGGPGAFSSVRIRGLRPEDTSLLIDGARFRDASATQGDATTLLSDLLVGNADRIEVLRGTGSALYGSNAGGGAINVITPAGGGPLRGSIEADGGSLGLAHAAAKASGGLNNDRFTHSLGVGHLNVAEGVDRDDRARNTSLQSRVGLRAGPTTLSLRVAASNAFTQVNGGPVGIGVLPTVGVVDAVPLPNAELRRYEAGTSVSNLAIGNANFIPSANDPDSRRHAHFLSTLLTFNHRPSVRYGYELSYHAMTTDRRFEDGPAGISGFEPAGVTLSDFKGRIDTISFRSDLQLTSRDVVTAGYQFERENYLSNSVPINPAASAKVDVTERSHALFLQDQLSLLNNSLLLSGAFRAQFFSLNTPDFTPAATSPYQGIQFAAPQPAYTGDASAVYFVRRTRTSLRTHIGNGYRAPSLFERFGTSFGSRGYSVFGDPRLKPERSLAIDAAIEQEFANGRAQVSIGGFSTRLQKLIIFDSSGVITTSTDPFGRSRGYRLVDGGTSRGFELIARAQPATWLRVTGSYTYADADPPSRTPTDLTQAYGMPRHNLSLTLLQHIGAHLQTDLAFSASSSYFAPVSDRVSFITRTYRFQGLRRLDLHAGYDFFLSDKLRLRVFGKIENATGQAYFESGFRTTGRIFGLGTMLAF